jgi:hypothetical protein
MGARPMIRSAVPLCLSHCVRQLDRRQGRHILVQTAARQQELALQLWPGSHGLTQVAPDLLDGRMGLGTMVMGQAGEISHECTRIDTNEWWWFVFIRVHSWLVTLSCSSHFDPGASAPT